jgi:hypothetical protein
VVLVDQAVEDRLPPDGAEVSQVGDRPRDRGFDGGRSLTAGLMRTMIVIVRGVFGDGFGQVPLVEDQHPIEHLTAKRSDDALADRIRPWSVWRGFDDPEAGGAEDLIEGGDELGVAVTDQEPQRVHPGTQLHGQVPGLLSHPYPGRVGGDPGQVQPAATVLDEYQDIQALQCDRVDREEVTRDDPMSLGGQELSPGRPGPARCWIDPGRVEDLPYRRGGDFMAEAGQRPGSCGAPSLGCPGPYAGSGS